MTRNAPLVGNEHPSLVGRPDAIQSCGSLHERCRLRDSCNGCLTRGSEPDTPYPGKGHIGASAWF
jgi:hypothetical protein